MSVRIDAHYWMEKHARRLAASGVANPGYELKDVTYRRWKSRAGEIQRLEAEVERLRAIERVIKHYLSERDKNLRHVYLTELIHLIDGDDNDRNQRKGRNNRSNERTNAASQNQRTG